MDLSWKLASLLRQTEYYFSDRNLYTDTFMRNVVEKDPDGFVAIDVLKTFPRLLSLSSDETLIVCALRQSKKLVVRSPPLSGNRRLVSLRRAPVL
jgi:hypothetical protein